MSARTSTTSIRSPPATRPRRRARRSSTDELPVGKSDKQDLSTHNEGAAEAIEQGQPTVEVNTGVPPTRPAYFAEAYVPVIENGKVRAVVETYVDQTAKRAEFHRAFTDAATKLGVLIALAFSAPAAGWYVRKREQHKTDARIHYLANFDSLSGVANRQRLTDGLAAALSSRSMTQTGERLGSLATLNGGSPWTS